MKKYNNKIRDFWEKGVQRWKNMFLEKHFLKAILRYSTKDIFFSYLEIIQKLFYIAQKFFHREEVEN